MRIISNTNVAAIAVIWAANAIGCASDPTETEAGNGSLESMIAKEAASGGVGRRMSLPETAADRMLADFQIRSAPMINDLTKLGESDPDFATVGLDASAGAVVVYRKGTHLAKQYLQVAGDVPVVVRPALLSGKETQTLMDSIWAARVDLAAKGIRITAVTTEWDGPVTIRVQRMTGDPAALIKQFSMFGSDSVKVEQGDPIVPASRFNDVSPYYAGNRINGPLGAFGDPTQIATFTSGFGGRSTTNGRHYMVTCYHGMKPSDPRVWTHSTLVGTASVLDAGHDLAYIPTSDTLPYVWDGPVYPTSSEFLKDVIGAMKPSKGMRICTLGSFSGARCYAEIKRMGHTDDLYNLYTLEHYDAYLYWAEKTDNTQIVAHGDSGGPVVVPSGNHVYAVGTVSGVGRSVACVTGSTGDATDCSDIVAFSDIYTEAVLNHDLDFTN